MYIKNPNPFQNHYLEKLWNDMTMAPPSPIATSTPKKSSIPSLSNPPNAPKKVKPQRNTFEEKLYLSWGVAEKYLRWVPTMVMAENSRRILLEVLDLYAFPDSQPPTYASLVYCEMMVEYVTERLSSLPRSHPSS